MPHTTTHRLTGLSIADTSHPIQTHHQLGGTGVVYNKALAIPGHLGGPWNSLEYVWLPPASSGEEPAVGEHVQKTDEIYFMLTGTAILTTNGVPEMIEALQVVIAPAGTRHTIRNVSSEQPLAFLVVELQVPPDAPAHEPTLLPALHTQEQESDPWHRATQDQRPIKLKVASLDLAPFFSSPFGTLSLVEIPPEGCIDEYSEREYDENIFVIQGQAQITVGALRFDSEAHGLNVCIPYGVPHSIINCSHTSPLHMLSLTVHRQESALSHNESLPTSKAENT